MVNNIPRITYEEACEKYLSNHKRKKIQNIKIAIGSFGIMLSSLSGIAYLTGDLQKIPDKVKEYFKKQRMLEYKIELLFDKDLEDRSLFLHAFELAKFNFEKKAGIELIILKQKDVVFSKKNIIEDIPESMYDATIAVTNKCFEAYNGKGEKIDFSGMAYPEKCFIIIDQINSRSDVNNLMLIQHELSHLLGLEHRITLYYTGDVMNYPPNWGSNWFENDEEKMRSVLKNIKNR
ncbi:hypothetical protein HYV79_03625 [Candidatus Woesearchaeota archaeon]|nr:hypothetical protein [Candidatus Woesearchaeota archaeon]